MYADGESFLMSSGGWEVEVSFGTEGMAEDVLLVVE